MPRYRETTCRPLALVVAASLVSLLLAANARAGGYDVAACDANAAGGAQNSFLPAADGGTTAYSNCPPGEGIVTRSVWDNGQSGYLQGAYEIFDAPPGAVVESLHATIYLERPDCNWSVGVYAGGFDLGGTGIWNWGPGSSCGSTTLGPLRRDLDVNAPRVRIEARCGASSCFRGQSTSGGPATAKATLTDVRVHVRDDSAPSLSNGRGGLWSSDAWMRGVQTIGFDASDGSGIRQADVRVDGATVRESLKPCDYTQRVPCPSEGLSTSIETAAIKPDGAHTLVLAAQDAGGNEATATRTVHVDNTPPAQPADPSVDGGDGWRVANGFDVRWSNPPEKGVAPIAGAEYELCPVSGGSCSRGSRDGADLTALKGVAVPRAGDWVMRLWLRDAAGNQDSRTAAPPLHLRMDDSAPTLAFEAVDEGDPTLVTVRTSDAGSGVVHGEIDIKSRTGKTWRPLPTKLDGGRLLARLDDEKLRDGTYELRAFGSDAAGNQGSTGNRLDGNAAQLTLPLRVKTRMRAGIARRGSRRIGRRSRIRVHYGRAVRLRGRLTSPDGNPIQGADVLVLSRARRTAASWRPVATLRTSRRGGFSYRAPKGVSRTIRFRYRGTGSARSATRDVVLLVRAGSTVHANRRSYVNGETMQLRGRLRGRSIPRAGKLVELQVLLRGRFRTFATTRANRRGRWHYGYTFDGTRGSQVYRFRVRVPREATYPYDTGFSRVMRIRVRGA